MSVPDETLDIQPVLPVGATPWTPDFNFGSGVLNPGGDKNPEAAARARAMIAAAGHHHAAAEPAEAPFQPVKPSNAPVSPAAQQAHPRTKAKHQVARWRPILNAVGMFLLLVLLFKAPVFYNQIKYQFAKPAPSSSNLIAADSPVSVSPEPVLIIPKINVQAPIVFEPSFEEAKVLKALERGVVHYGNTAKPGEVGNAVITGHSSNDWWQPGNYKFVFVLLGKLAPGDPILLNYEGTQYKYEVTERKIVEPTDVSVIAPTGTPTLTLITCWPVGTNLKREIIHAKQISPVPGASGPIKIAQTPDTKGLLLPGSTRTITEQIGDFWNSVTGAFSQKPTEVKAK